MSDFLPFNGQEGFLFVTEKKSAVLMFEKAKVFAPHHELTLSCSTPGATWSQELEDGTMTPPVPFDRFVKFQDPPISVNITHNSDESLCISFGNGHADEEFLGFASDD